MEDGIGDAWAGAQIEAGIFQYLGLGEDQIAHQGKEVLPDTAHQAAIYKSLGWRIVKVQLQATFSFQHLDIEISMALEQGASVVGAGATGQHGKRAGSQQSMQVALGGGMKMLDFLSREHLEGASWLNHHVVDGFRSTHGRGE
jgi:hypothetical protein